MSRLWVALIGMAAVVRPVGAQAQGAAAAAFEVASVKHASGGGPPGDVPRNMDDSPGHFAMRNVSLRFALEWAYNLKDFELTGPDWINSEERYDIEARAGRAASNEEMRPMLQTLLKDRLQMKIHFEKKDISVYLLVPGPGTPKVTEAAADGQPSISGAANGATFHNQPISRFTFMLTRRLDRPVLDRTGLKGVYDYTVDLSGLGFNGGPSQDPDAPSIFTTIQRDMGLKLEPKKEPIDVLIIDHAEKVPIAN
jgi:uncharacterized protein (TIGR03435 family)